jgi:hypothetical protein
MSRPPLLFKEGNVTRFSKYVANFIFLTAHYLSLRLLQKVIDQTPAASIQYSVKDSAFRENPQEPHRKIMRLPFQDFESAEKSIGLSL